MLFDSLLLGRAIRWEFPGVRDLNSWVEERPWENEGGVYVVSVPKDLSIDTYYNAVLKLVFSCSDGARIRNKFFDLIVNEKTLRQSLGELFGWQLTDGNHSFRELLRTYQAGSEGLVYFALTTRQADIDEAFAMVDFCAKAGTSCPLTIIIFSPGGDVSASPRFIDMKTGWINEHFFHDWENKSELDLWHSYNYHRFIWEAGGSPNVVTLMEQSFIKNGSLDRTEITTERAILGCVKNLGLAHENNLTALSQFLGDGRDVGTRTEDVELTAQHFASLGLLWKPRQCKDWILPGWVARYLIQSQTKINPWLLRRSVNCLALTGEIFTACISLELRFRQRYVSAINPNHIPISALDLFTAWTRGGGDREFVCYSEGIEPGNLNNIQSGSHLDDAWIFSSIGEIQIGLKKSQPVGRHSKNFLDAIERLRLMRNSLAHSHPTSWNHIMTLKKITSLL